MKNPVETLKKLNHSGMFEGDFFLTWEKTKDELLSVFAVADALRDLRSRNISTRV